jgi:thiamine-phosphate pyrophosphorylase
MAAHETARVSARAALLHGIYAIVNEGARDPLLAAHAALDAGVGVVQYRAKNGIVPARLNALRTLTRNHAALLIVNDDWRAALTYDCDGVHLGPDDGGFGAIPAVRAAVGDRLIGVSCGTVAEAAGAHLADYIGVGSVYPTGSKADAGHPIGIEGLERVARATALPVAAIGGINAQNLLDVRASGVAMAAVISAIDAAADPAAAAAQLVALWNAAR